MPTLDRAVAARHGKKVAALFFDTLFDNEAHLAQNGKSLIVARFDAEAAAMECHPVETLTAEAMAGLHVPRDIAEGILGLLRECDFRRQVPVLVFDGTAEPEEDDLSFHLMADRPLMPSVLAYGDSDTLN